MKLGHSLTLALRLPSCMGNVVQRRRLRLRRGRPWWVSGRVQ